MAVVLWVARAVLALWFFKIVLDLVKAMLEELK